MTIKILAFSGSARSDSFNHKLLKVAALGAADSGAEVTNISLGHYALPFYNGDLEIESGLPDNAAALQKLVAESDALLIASPDYNGGYSALLKNTLDWISRPNRQGVSGIDYFANKPVAVVSASPGPMGGTRGHVAIRAVLDKLGMVLIPQSFALRFAHTAFDNRDCLKDAEVDAAVRAVGAALVRTAFKFAA
ncbi:MAG TPA: NAD(P)H-dependent oxidoreductase [Paraburkholderia sp.]|jgi:NAD(P)H-dependent FMN reductase